MLKIVRYAEFTTTPWKNGGGITHEALRKNLAATGEATQGGGTKSPATTRVAGERSAVELSAASEFLWRLSVARVDGSGPFSNFAGYRRTLVLLQGDGVRLSFSDRTVTELREVGDLATFDGALGAECLLLGGPCVDLNLMTAAAVTVAGVGVEPVAKEVHVDDPSATTFLIFCMGGAVLIESQGAAAVLGKWDVAAASATSGVRLAPQEAAHAATVFIARLID